MHHQFIWTAVKPCFTWIVLMKSSTGLEQNSLGGSDIKGQKTASCSKKMGGFFSWRPLATFLRHDLNMCPYISTLNNVPLSWLWHKEQHLLRHTDTLQRVCCSDTNNETYNDCSVLSHEAICQSCLQLVQLHLHRVHSLSDCFTLPYIILKSVNRRHKTDSMNTSRGVLLIPKTDVLLSKHWP